MPETSIVVNTGPLLALASAEKLEALHFLYEKVYVTAEVCQEILEGGKSGFGITPFIKADWLIKLNAKQNPGPLLSRALDAGEASVIHLALDKEIKTVCIDEALGRRVARLHGLNVTGSLGVLLKAKKSGFNVSIRDSIQRMMDEGIFLSPELIEAVIHESGE